MSDPPSGTEEQARFNVTLRDDETPMDAARRNAIDAVYHARDSGGTMHDAGKLAAEAAVKAYKAQSEHLSDGESNAVFEQQGYTRRNFAEDK